MSDLISKSALVDRLSDAAVNAKAIEESSCANASTYYAGIKCGFWNAAIIADNFPTVDAVPVVRCKDCKYSKLWYSERRRCFLWSETGNSVWDDGYCSYGERSEE